METTHNTGKANTSNFKFVGLCITMLFVIIISIIFFSTSLNAQNPTTTWNGLVSSDWNNSANWTNGVPNSTVSAIIFMHCPNYPVINSTANCLNIEIQTSSYLTIGDYKTLNVYGNWTNNHVLNPGKGKVVFKGNNTTFNGVATNFYNITIDKVSSIDELILNANISVTNNITMLKGDVNLNNGIIDLGTTGSIMNESNDNKIYDNYLTGNGKITVNRINLTPTTEEFFGNIGITITSDQNFGNTIITRSHKRQTINNTGVSVYRYYDISPEKNYDLNAVLVFNFFDEEIPVGVNKADLLFYASEDNGINWENNKGAIIPSTNTISKNAIEKFSRWTASNYSDIPTTIAENNISNDAFSIYPNPAADFVSINSNSLNKNYMVKIINKNGTIVKNIKIFDNAKIDINELASGMYCFNITDVESGEQFNRKIVVK